MTAIVPTRLSSALADRYRIDRELGARVGRRAVFVLARASRSGRHSTDSVMQSVNELLRGRRAVSPEMAIRLSRLFSNSAEFWMNAQRAVHLWDARQALKV